MSSSSSVSTRSSVDVRANDKVQLKVDKNTVTSGEITANHRRAISLAILAGLLPGLVLGVIVWLAVNPISGAISFLACVAALALAIWAFAPSVVLRSLGASKLAERTCPRIFNTSDGLCATFGLSSPEIWVVVDRVPNACALGRDPSEGILVVTTGLIDSLDVVELEGVVAHELAHIKRHDTVVSSVALALCIPLSFFGFGDDLFHKMVGYGREYRADQVAIAAVRYPPGLGAALGIFTDGPTPLKDSLFTRKHVSMGRWLWIDPSLGNNATFTGSKDLDSLEIRTAALSEY